MPIPSERLYLDVTKPRNRPSATLLRRTAGGAVNVSSPSDHRGTSTREHRLFHRMEDLRPAKYISAPTPRNLKTSYELGERVVAPKGCRGADYERPAPAEIQSSSGESAFTTSHQVLEVKIRIPTPHPRVIAAFKSVENGQCRSAIPTKPALAIRIPKSRGQELRDKILREAESYKQSASRGHGRGVLLHQDVRGIREK